MSKTDFDFFLGPLRSAREGGERALRFQVAPQHLTDQGMMAESLLTALAARLLGLCAESDVDEPETVSRPALLSLSCDVVGQVGDGDMLEGDARIMRQTRTLLFVSGELCREGKPVVVATGIWKKRAA